MYLADWLAKNERGTLALIVEGASRDVLEKVLGALAQRALVLADRTLAGVLLPTIAFRPEPRIEVRLSNGLLKDLTNPLVLNATGPIIVAAEVLESDIAGEMRRAQDQLIVLAGYPAPPNLVSTIVSHRFAKAISRFQDTRATPLVIHDRLGWLPSALFENHLIFEAEGPADTATPDPVAATLNADFRAPTSEELIMQSEYLVRTDMNVLVDMHQWLAGPSASGVLQYWSSQLARVKNTQGHELFVQFAQEKLAELNAALAGRKAA